ncbi:MAG TPA: hydrogenase maturation protease [Burkholderiaceae bacterium]|nr:hydrogenase maturation protease [Burkholderiaceae bacterium]
MKRTAILGIGSPFGDDRAGWLVIDTLQASLDEHERASAGLTLAALDRPGAELLEHLRGADRAVLIDAVRDAGAPGAVVRLDPAQLEATVHVSSHGLGVAEALALGAALQALPPEFTVLGIATDGDPRRTDMSVAVQGAALHLARELQRWIRDGAACQREFWPTAR